MRSLIDPPPRSALARFKPGFAPRFVVTLAAGNGLADFAHLCRSEGVEPLDLSDPVRAPNALEIDCSVHPLFDLRAQGGADFRLHPLVPYWLDDARTRLELPATSAFWGLLRRQGTWLYPWIEHRPRLQSWLARLGILERIALAPGRIGVEQAIRAIDISLDDGLPVLVFASANPPTGSSSREVLLDWWQRVFAYLELRGVKPTTAAEIVRSLER